MIKEYSERSDFGKKWVDGTIESLHLSVHIRTLDSSKEALQKGAHITLSLVFFFFKCAFHSTEYVEELMVYQ